MSNFTKAQGARIGIGLTEELKGFKLDYPKYKFFRWNIDTLWSSRVYLYGIELKTDGDYFLPTGTITASSQYSATYSADKAFDGNASNYWRPNTYPAWIQIELAEPILLTGFQWNTSTSSYRPRAFSLLGSNNGIDWDILYEGESQNVNNWKGFSIVPVLKSGNESAFKITGKQYRYINGDLLDMEYKVKLVSLHPTIENALLLEFDTFDRFPTVEGKITVAYDAMKGNLTGRGGAVESFSVSFSPKDLVPEPNIGIREYITVAPSVQITFITMEYVNAYADEHITVAPSVQIRFEEKGIINP